MSDEMPPLTDEQLDRFISSRVRKRLRRGEVGKASDISDFRRFLDMTQEEFARAMGISVHTLRNWEQGRRHPQGPALALLRLAARHPRLLRESLEVAA